MAGIDPRFYYLTLGLLALCVGVGLVVAYRFQREVDEDLAPPTERDLLGPLEKAYYSGLMREEEFERIQASMARHKGEEHAPAAKPARPRANPATATTPGPEQAPEGGADAGSTADGGGEGPPPVTPGGDSGRDPAPG